MPVPPRRGGHPTGGRLIHAATQSNAAGNMTSRNGSVIGYTSYNLPSLIMAGSNSSTLSYGASRNRKTIRISRYGLLMRLDDSLA
jgi:hypothetical protein